MQQKSTGVSAICLALGVHSVPAVWSYPRVLSSLPLCKQEGAGSAQRWGWPSDTPISSSQEEGDGSTQPSSPPQEPKVHLLGEIGGRNTHRLAPGQSRKSACWQLPVLSVMLTSPQCTFSCVRQAFQQDSWS